MNLPKGGSFYAALLWLLPLEFRHRHGAEMEAVFSDMLGDVRGPISWLLLHVGAVGDVLRLAWAEEKRELGITQVFYKDVFAKLVQESR